jgi:hypothetical protein
MVCREIRMYVQGFFFRFLYFEDYLIFKSQRKIINY